ncbi:MAG TPA: hypothetical protein VEC36_06450 [Patescibacteria group bacterium]|nr:hypothetical protein [Patescibacteria group bacterium]
MKFLLALALAFALVQPAFSQDDELDDFKFDDAPGAETEAPYFAVAGGYLATLFFPSFEELNKTVTGTFGLEELKTPVFVQGGEGFIAFPYIKNSRIGFFGIAGGTDRQRDVRVANPVAETDTLTASRNFEYRVSFTGISLDYALMLGRKFAIVPNARVGFGTMSLQAYQGVEERNWTDFNASANNVNYLNRLEANYWFVQPGIHFEFAATPFFMVRASGGYTLSFMPGEWEYNHVSRVTTVPSEIKATGATAQIGIFLGLFQ